VAYVSQLPIRAGSKLVGNCETPHWPDKHSFMHYPAAILGVGRGVPERLVHSAEYDARYGKPAGWTEATTGVAARRFLAENETASMIGERAARAALAMAQMQPRHLSAVLGACGVMEQPIPSFAVLLHRRLGLAGSGVPAFDVNATCLSFLVALRTAALEIAVGAWERVLIVSSDAASAALDEADPDTAPLFGDGAAAALIGRAAEAGSDVCAWRFETYSEGAEAAWLGAGGSRLPARNLDALLAESIFRMDGPLAFRIAARQIEPFLARLLDEAGWTLGDVDLVVPHQASGPALALMKRRLGLADDRVMEILSDHGNQVASSLPTALALAIETGRAKKGDRLLLIGTGAGVSLAGAALVL
jgi:3-oxoacyl-[acyl-carrier-protein] synthase-3